MSDITGVVADVQGAASKGELTDDIKKAALMAAAGLTEKVSVGKPVSEDQIVPSKAAADLGPKSYDSIEYSGNLALLPRAPEFNAQNVENPSDLKSPGAGGSKASAPGIQGR